MSAELAIELYEGYREVKGMVDLANGMSHDPGKALGRAGGGALGFTLGSSVCGLPCGLIGDSLGGMVGGWVGSKIGSLISKPSTGFAGASTNRNLFDEKRNDIRGRPHEIHSSNTLNVNPARTANAQRFHSDEGFWGHNRTADGRAISRFPMGFDATPAYGDMATGGFGVVAYGGDQRHYGPTHASESTGHLPFYAKA